ncbi:unnamed protein product [Spirodela intermedia]|uniref:DUF4408 domain-containing protein n=1 Tax=Spirodela intermedia TaxID=51605 RepID=A0A7I8K557_SPIIN|nr:unnamed protein product [Spirodela intermedia]
MVLSGKVLLVSTGVVSTAVVLRLYWPAVVVFMPQIYVAALGWLAPPYLYCIVNLIIIFIAVSSSYHPHQPVPPAEPLKLPLDAHLPAAFLPGGGPAEELGGATASAATEEEEKPLVSMRFSARRGAKASHEGRPLGVAKPKKNETLESTWKAITEGRGMPLARRLKKADGGSGGGAEWGSSSPPRGGGLRLRREPSTGQEELNRRVEAFIKKFNDDIRLQRQESFKRFSALR